jgi:hypothetical protein
MIVCMVTVRTLGQRVCGGPDFTVAPVGDPEDGTM